MQRVRSLTRVVVTGGAGFIGSHLVDQLVDLGHSVTVVDNLEPQVHRTKPTYLNPSARYLFEAVSNPVSLKSVAQAEVVFHFASIVGVGQSMYQVERYVDSNVGETASLLQALTQPSPEKKRKLIVASSMSVYGEGSYDCDNCGFIYPSLRTKSQLELRRWDLECPKCGSPIKPVPTSESRPLTASSVYAITKRDQEELCLLIGRSYNIPTIALRFFNVYGPRQSLDNPYTGVCSIFQSRIKNGKAPLIFEDGLQSRDFVSVHDVVTACILAMDAPIENGEVVNIGSGSSVPIIQLSRLLLKLYGKSEWDPRIENKSRAGDVRHCFADISKAKKILRYNPQIDIEDGLRELVEWGQKRGSVDSSDEAYSILVDQGLIGE
ncbi:MAG TPA: NAD-dependent epimerase/dehydratase family protein [Candidatus Angelobacter sp.]|nr:NAD-dependent epimerase/dehydratase family protein [Candidatus Angelobacter sp.]